jgi:hypothetical protein
LPGSSSSLALGLAWAYRIIAVSAEMVLPGLLGNWLDERLGAHFLVFVGFGLGITAGIWHLLLMTRQDARQLSARRGLPKRDVDERKP